MLEVPHRQTWVGSEGEEIRVWQGVEREEVKNVPDGGGLERRSERAWCILGNRMFGRSFSREGSGPVEGLSGQRVPSNSLGSPC